jgi:hypothetical protein
MTVRPPTGELFKIRDSQTRHIELNITSDDVAGLENAAPKRTGQFTDANGRLRNADGTFASGGETASAARGRQAHENYKNALPGDYEHQVTLDSGKRPDAVNWQTRNVRELKPDNPRAVARGRRQVEAYRKELEKMTGQKWTSNVDTYNP